MASRLREFGEIAPATPELFPIYFTEEEMGDMMDCCLMASHLDGKYAVLRDQFRVRLEKINNDREFAKPRTF
jgi:hypothetical protein